MRDDAEALFDVQFDGDLVPERGVGAPEFVEVSAVLLRRVHPAFDGDAGVFEEAPRRAREVGAVDEDDLLHFRRQLRMLRAVEHRDGGVGRAAGEPVEGAQIALFQLAEFGEAAEADLGGLPGALAAEFVQRRLCAFEIQGLACEGGAALLDAFAPAEQHLVRGFEALQHVVAEKFGEIASVGGAQRFEPRQHRLRRRRGNGTVDQLLRHGYMEIDRPAGIRAGQRQLFAEQTPRFGGRRHDPQVRKIRRERAPPEFAQFLRRRLRRGQAPIQKFYFDSGHIFQKIARIGQKSIAFCEILLARGRM